MLAKELLIAGVGFVRNVRGGPVTQPPLGELRDGFFARIYILAGRSAGDDFCQLGLRLLLSALDRDVAIRSRDLALHRI
jgi:hypothetical protein